MATALDVISGALKLLGVRAAESPIEDNEAQDGLVSLNDMLNEWDEVKKTCLGFETLDTVQDELYVDDGVIGAIKANLAVYIAPEYQRLVSPALQQRADDGFKAIRASKPLDPLQYPDSLPVGSGNQDNGYSGNGDVPGSAYGGAFYPGNTTKCS